MPVIVPATALAFSLHSSPLLSFPFSLPHPFFFNKIFPFLFPARVGTTRTPTPAESSFHGSMYFHSHSDFVYDRDIDNRRHHVLC